MSSTSTEGGVAAEDRAAVLDVVHAFHRHIDRGQATRGISLVAEDADFTIRGQRMQGRAAVADFLARREAQADRHTVHVIGSSIVSPAPGGALTVESLLLMHTRDAEGALRLDQVFEIVHTLVVHEGSWQIRDRSMTPLHP